MFCLSNFIRNFSPYGVFGSILLNVDQKMLITSIDRLVINLGNLPNEIICMIVNYLCIKDRLNVRQLNRKWRQMSLIGITKVLVGKESSIVMSYPEYEIDLKDDLSNCEIFKLLIKEWGHMLKTLIIDLTFDNFPNEWLKKLKQMLVMIWKQCANIDELCINFQDHGLNEFALSLFKHYGRQLKSASLYHQFRKSGACDFAIKHFDHKMLHRLSVKVSNQSELNKIANAFTFMSKFEFDYENEKEILNFECLQKWTHLEELYCEYFFPDQSFRSLVHSLANSKNLHTLSHIGLLYQVSSSSIKLFRNLMSLQSLIIYPTCEQLSVCVNVLKNLPHLAYLDFTLAVELAEQNLFQNTLKAMVQLKKLKILRFYLCFDEGVKFSFCFFQPMLSVTDLEVHFSESDGLIEQERFELGRDVRNLFKAFPTVNYLCLKSKKMSTDDLLECVENLIQLKSLQIWNVSDQEEHRLKELCDIKGIDLQRF